MFSIIPQDNQMPPAVTDNQFPALTNEDFDVLASHSKATAWDKLPENDRIRFRNTRQKLLQYATALANRLPSKTKLVPFASHQNPSGKNPLYQWCCAFAQSAGDKSYGFQLFLIIRPTHVELGFASGTGSGGNKNNQEALRGQLEGSKKRLLVLRNSKIVKMAFEAAESRGLRLRHKWLGTPADPGMLSLDEWIEHATSPNGNGAAISTFWSREEVEDLGSKFFEQLLSTMTIFAPVMDAIYAYDPGPEEEEDGDKEGAEGGDEGKEIQPAIIAANPYTIANIIEDGCFIGEPQLKEVLERLKSKKNLILQGPPWDWENLACKARRLRSYWSQGSKQNARDPVPPITIL
jgi:hypothetical protein